MEHLDDKEDITIYMHTKAISTYALNSLVDVMAYVKPEVATVCVGTVAGVASTVLAAGERYKHSRVVLVTILPDTSRICQRRNGSLLTIVFEFVLYTCSLICLLCTLGTVEAKGRQCQIVELCFASQSLVLKGISLRWGLCVILKIALSTNMVCLSSVKHFD